MSTIAKLIIITAPSGAGKTTIVRYLLENIQELSFSISATTRPARENEIHGKDYYFISENEFRYHIDRNHFLEWEEVYPGRFYGTLQTEVERLWSLGKHVVFDIDVMGALHLQKKFPDKSITIFIAPPSLGILHQRLTARKTESEKTLATRLQRAEMELSKSDLFDKTIINDDLAIACTQAKEVVQEFLAR